MSMDFLKENWKLITIAALVFFALTSVFELEEKVDLGDGMKPVSISQLGVTSKQVIYENDNHTLVSNLKLGLDLVGGSQFEFQAKATEQVPEITQKVMHGLIKVFENRVNASGTTEAIVQQVGKDRLLVEVPGADPMTVKRRLLATANLEFKEVSNWDAVQQDKSLEWEWADTGITGAMLKSAQAAPSPNGAWSIEFELKEEAARAFGELTSRLVEKPLGIFLDGNEISAPTVRSAITGGRGEISGDFTHETAQDLAVQLNAGALPVPVKVLQERSIGATLGKESVSKSLKAGIFGFLCVIAFMILFYRVPGFVASLALTIYAALALWVFQSTVTLTLAGVAGFILSIGMAVDANILIFERAKEEIRQGKSVLIAVRDGFDGAYTSIFDSNMNTSMVCLILIMFGAGIVKGFAFTLLIGVVLSLFSSLFITKTLLFAVVKLFNIKGTAWMK